MENGKNFSQFILDYLSSMGLSNKQIEDSIGINEQQRSRISTGKRKITLLEFFSMYLYISKKHLIELLEQKADPLNSPEITMKLMLEHYNENHHEVEKSSWSELG